MIDINQWLISEGSIQITDLKFSKGAIIIQSLFSK